MEIEDNIRVADRTDLETALDCPQKLAFQIAQPHKLTPHAAQVGIECHEAISATIETYVREGLGKRELAEYLERELLSRRPDLLPEVIEAVRPSVWTIASFLADKHPQDIIRYDGGRGAYSGQLARDITVGDDVVRVTTELDLLTATASPEVVEDCDWKSGHTPYDIDSVQRAFQFRLHASLLFENYPEVQEVRVRVLRTQYNDFSRPVAFKRRDAAVLDAQIYAAAVDWLAVTKGRMPQRRPTEEKCGRCRFATNCFPGLEAPTPGDLVDWLVIANAGVAAAEKQLKAVIGKSGDVVGTRSGHRYGTNKPREKATFSLYQPKPNDA